MGITSHDKVAIWQKDSHGADDEISTTIGVIGSLFDSLISCLKFVIQNLESKNNEHAYRQDLERNAAALLFWGLDHGVSKGELDTSLQHSKHLREPILLVLVSIADLISGSVLKLFLQARRVEVLKTSKITHLAETAMLTIGGADTSYTRQPDEEQDVSELLSALHFKIECLYKLNASLECPAESESEDEEPRAGAVIHDLPIHQYFAGPIAERFPTADRKLVDILGQANWSRYNHIKRQREAVPDDTELVTTGTSDPELSAAKTIKSQFHDSGIGSSIPAYSVYAATVVSSRAEASHKRLPPLPKLAREGEPLTCEICDRTISLRRLKDWRKHVFKDICAYTCMIPNCPTAGALFEDIAVMISHMETYHCDKPGILDLVCPLCKEHVHGPVESASIHLARHMEEVALGVLPRDAESEEDSDTSNSSNANTGSQEDALAADHELNVVAEEHMREDTHAETVSFSRKEKYIISSIDLNRLAQDLQSKEGIEMIDRRWHLKVYEACFSGSDLVKWLILNFQDVEDRDCAVELGTELLKGGLFERIDDQGGFRDGQFFYQINPEYRRPRNFSLAENSIVTWPSRDGSIPIKKMANDNDASRGIVDIEYRPQSTTNKDGHDRNIKLATGSSNTSRQDRPEDTSSMETKEHKSDHETNAGKEGLERILQMLGQDDTGDESTIMKSSKHIHEPDADKDDLIQLLGQENTRKETGTETSSGFTAGNMGSFTAVNAPLKEAQDQLLTHLPTAKSSQIQSNATQTRNEPTSETFKDGTTNFDASSTDVEEDEDEDEDGDEDGDGDEDEDEDEDEDADEDEDEDEDKYKISGMRGDWDSL